MSLMETRAAPPEKRNADGPIPGAAEGRFGPGWTAFLSGRIPAFPCCNCTPSQGPWAAYSLVPPPPTPPDPISQASPPTSPAPAASAHPTH